MANNSQVRQFSIIGSALSGNKGAASMLESAIQNITDDFPSAKFLLFSMYPKADLALNKFKNLEILNASPIKLALIINPLAALFRLIPPFRPLLRRHSRSVSALLASEFLLDQMGISFSDGREKFLIYHVAAILPALFLRTPVLKSPQSIGPFEGRMNGLVSRFFLPKITRVIARGAKSQDHAFVLGLTNTKMGVDAAFGLQLREPDESRAILSRSGLSNTDNLRLIGVCPSQVVKHKFEGANLGSYEEKLAEIVRELRLLGHTVVIFPHSARWGVTATHNNDLPVCREVARLLSSDSGTYFVDEELSPQQLRYLVAWFAACITSRFHAMISSLAVGTRPIVIGWGHKYAETLDFYKLAGLAVDFRSMTAEAVTTILSDSSRWPECDRRSILQTSERLRELAVSQNVWLLSGENASGAAEAF